MHRRRHLFGILPKIAIPILFITVFACDDNFVKPPIKPQKMLECHGEIQWNALSIRNTLIDEWNLIHKSCWLGSSNIDDGSISVEFRSDSPLTALEEGIEKEATWQVKSFGDSLFILEMDPFVHFVFGHIYVCDDLVLFKEGHHDGCDYYIKRQ
jgi:hypothetical protein